MESVFKNSILFSVAHCFHILAHTFFYCGTYSAFNGMAQIFRRLMLGSAQACESGHGRRIAFITNVH
jgi:hypothetical protein